MSKPSENATSLLLAAMMLTLFALGLGCDENGGDRSGGGCANVHFDMTPSAGSAFSIDVEACTHEPSLEGCRLEILDVAGDDRFIQWLVDEPVGCGSSFDARISDANGVYTMFGFTVREFGTGTGPFATGTYTEDGSGDAGSFEFHEDEFNAEPLP